MRISVNGLRLLAGLGEHGAQERLLAHDAAEVAGGVGALHAVA